MILGKLNRKGGCQCPTDGTPSSGMTTPYAIDICRHPTVQPPRLTTESEGVHGTAAQNTVRTNVHLQRQGRMKGQKGRSDPNSRTIPGGIACGTFDCSCIYCRYTAMLLGGRRVIKANALGIDALKRKETISQYKHLLIQHCFDRVRLLPWQRFRLWHCRRWIGSHER